MNKGIRLKELSGGEIAHQRLIAGAFSKLNSSTYLASGRLAILIWYLIERTCFPLISAFSR